MQDNAVFANLAQDQLDRHQVDRQWYAVSVMVGSEDRAERHLRRQDYRPFLPRQRRTVRHARRLITRQAALFPGYMFIPLDLVRERWRPINGTIGVRSLVMQGGRPVPCPRGLVEGFIALSDADGVLDFSGGLAAGQAVRIVAGPFSDLVGTLLQLEGSDRARLLLKLMNSEIAITMDAKDLVAV